MEIGQLTTELQNLASPAASPASSLSTAAPQINPFDQNEPMQPGRTPIPMRPSSDAPGAMSPPDTDLAVPGTRILGSEPLSFSQKIARAADSLKIPAKPGGWAISLVGAAQKALSGIQDTLADAATASKEAVPGEGALAALGHIRNAQIQRQQAQQKAQTEQQQAQATIASTNVQRMYHQTLMHQLSDEINDKDIKYGQSQVAAMTDHLTSLGLKPADVLAKDITEAQLQKGLDNQVWKPGEDTWLPTGSFEVPGKKDADGNPLRQKTFTVLKVPPQQTLTKEQVGRVNQFVPGVKFDPENPPTMSGAAAQSLMEQAHQGETVSNLHEQDMLDAKVKKLTAEAQINAKEAEDRLKKDPNYIKARSQAKGNLIGVLDYLSKNDPQGASDFIQSYGGQKNFDTIVDAQTKEAEQIRHDRELEIIAAKKEAKDNNAVGVVPLTPEVQARIDSLPDPQRKLIGQYDPNTQASLMSIAFGNGEQDLEKNFPSRLTKGAPGLNTQQALGVITQLNPKWSEQSYAVKHDKYKDATTGKLSQQADSLNNFIGHAAQAQEVTDRFFNADPRIFKSVINALEKQTYGTDVVSLEEALDVVNSEFQTMVNSGFAPTTDQREAQATLVNPKATVGQINAALKVMGHMANTRAGTMDNNYFRATGDHFPSLITADNQDAARKLGINVEKFYSGGRIGGSGNAPQQQVTQTGTPGAVTTTNPNAGQGAGSQDFFGQFNGRPR